MNGSVSDMRWVLMVALVGAALTLAYAFYWPTVRESLRAFNARDGIDLDALDFRAHNRED
jgi:high-affinity Fe2+/Pb2+ permease